MPWWAIACAAFFGAVTGITGVGTAIFAFRFFRRSARVAENLEPRAGRLEHESELLALRSEQLALTQARLARGQAAIGASVARLRVLGWALEDVRLLVGLVRAGIPTK